MDLLSDRAVAEGASPGNELSLLFFFRSAPRPGPARDLHGPAQDREHFTREPLAHASPGRVEAAALQGLQARPEPVPLRACGGSARHTALEFPEAQEEVLLQPLQETAQQLPLDARQPPPLLGRYSPWRSAGAPARLWRAPRTRARPS